MAIVALAGLVLLVPVAACGQQAEEGEADGVRAAESGARDPEAATAAAPTNVYGDSMPHPTVRLDTSLGDILLELFPEDAPRTVENFLTYVESDFYDGLIFHRVIPNFVVQAGGHRPDMTIKEATRPPIRNESDNELRNLRGTVAMARTRDPHSARAQFFINLVDNPNLDHRGSPDAWGYTVFGRVIDGMDVVDEIARRRTGRTGPLENVPVEPIVVEAITRGADVEPKG